MLELLGTTAQGFNDWRLCAMSPLHPGLLVLLGLVLLAAVGVAGRTLWRAAGRERAMLLGLRGLAALLLALLLWEPGIELLATVRERGRLAVLIDASASMALSDGDATRWQRAQARVQELEPGLRALGERYDLEVYRFGETAVPVADTRVAMAAAPTAPRTDILAALEAVAPGPGKRALGGVIVVSDGADNGALKHGVGERALAVLAALKAPLVALPVADGAAFRDLAIDDVIADDFAFVRNAVEVEAVVQSRGLGARTLPVTLRQNGQVVGVAQLALDPAQPSQKVSFKFTPVETGKQSYLIETPVQEGEAIAENNRRAFSIKIIRDRIRVLQVAGRPSWDERFLRRLLKSNPSVDLISFFILRTQSDQSGSNDELSLIPFPTDELFTKELKSFDVVIWQNFNYRPYHMGQYLQNVRDFVVEQGGGFAMVGGDLSFAEGGYGGTPVAEILPVQVGFAPGQYRRASYRPLPTAAGRSHPILELESDPVEQVLQRLPALDGFNLTPGLMPGAQVLLEHPYERQAGQGAPVLALREVGRGRSLALLSDDSWHWSLPDAGQGGRGAAHRHFWANALRWLIRDPALSRVRLEVSKREVDPGVAVEVRARAFDAAYQPLPGAQLQLTVVREEEGGGSVLDQALVANADGEAQLTVPPQASGSYRVVVKGTAPDGNGLGSDDEVLLVRGSALERADARPRPELLRELAQRSGGALLDNGEAAGRFNFVDADLTRIHRARRVPLWDNAYVLGLLVLVLGLEWWLRRRWGFA